MDLVCLWNVEPKIFWSTDAELVQGWSDLLENVGVDVFVAAGFVLQYNGGGGGGGGEGGGKF